jgi:hypothetical protein
MLSIIAQEIIKYVSRQVNDIFLKIISLKIKLNNTEPDNESINSCHKTKIEISFIPCIE